MSLDAIPSGSRVLLDANILIYAKEGLSDECRRLLLRCETGDVIGLVSAVAVAEFCHRRMMQEAQSLGLVGSNPARNLGQNRSLLSKLTKWEREVRQVMAGDLTVLDLTAEDLAQGLELQHKYLLLTNDSLQVATAIRASIPLLISNDPQFEGIPGITRLAPTDIAIT